LSGRFIGFDAERHGLLAEESNVGSHGSALKGVFYLSSNRMIDSPSWDWSTTRSLSIRVTVFPSIESPTRTSAPFIKTKELLTSLDQTMASMAMEGASVSTRSAAASFGAGDFGISELADNGLSSCGDAFCPSAEGGAVLPSILCPWMVFGKIHLRSNVLSFNAKTPRTARAPNIRKAKRNTHT